MQADLGIAPPDDRDGCLQDVHWYYGGIGGGFQGYTIGNILSAQFYAAAVQGASRHSVRDRGRRIRHAARLAHRQSLPARPQVHAQRPDQARDRRADDHAALSRLSARQVRRALFACRCLITASYRALFSAFAHSRHHERGTGRARMRVRSVPDLAGAAVAAGVAHADRRLERRVAAPGVTRFADKRPNAMPVDVELVIAVDVSNSMDPEEQELQRDGYVAALTSREFLQALRSGAHGKVARDLFRMGRPVRPDHPDAVAADRRARRSADAVAREIARAPYRRAPRTSIYGALQFAKPLFDASGYRGHAPGHRCLRRRRQQHGAAGRPDARRRARRRHHHQRPADHAAARRPATACGAWRSSTSTSTTRTA